MSRRLSLVSGLCALASLCGFSWVDGQEVEPDSRVLALDSLLSIEIRTAARYEQTSREAPSSVTIITSEDIEQYGYRTIYEALISVRGFQGSYDRNYFSVGARGFSREGDYNNRLLMLVDGHRLNDDFYGQAYPGLAVGIPMAAIERIEIVRGPGSALYGSNAMLAVINLVTKTGQTLDRIHVRGEAGSWGRKSTAVEFGRRLAGDVDVLLAAEWHDISGQNLFFPEFAAPETNDGLSEGLDWERHWGAYGKISFGDLRLISSVSVRDKGIPTGAWDILFNTENYTKDGRFFADVQYDRDLSAYTYLRARAYYDRAWYSGDYPYSQEDGGVWQESNNVDSYGVELELGWDASASNRLQFGLEARHAAQASLLAEDEEQTWISGDWPYGIVSLFVQDQWQATETLLLTLGLRSDTYTDWGTAVTPRAAVVFHASSSGTAKLLYGEAFRAPNLFELHFTDRNIRANPDLGAERVRTLEMVWEQRFSEGLFGTVSLYRQGLRDLIARMVVNDAPDPSGDEQIEQFVNVGRASTRGAEVELRAQFGPTVQGYASFAVQRAEVGGERLTNSPTSLFRAGAVVSPVPNWSIAANLSYDQDRLTIRGGRTGSFTVANVTVSGRRLLGRLDASLSLRNLFDERYETPGGFEHVQNGIAQDGRNVRLTLGVSF